MDNYQAVYDAVRSRVGHVDADSVLREFLYSNMGDVGHAFHNAAQELQFASQQQSRPSAIYKPSIYRDGDKWCALYGDNLQEGVCGFGDSPSLAMESFDEAFVTKVIGLEKTG